MSNTEQPTLGKTVTPLTTPMNLTCAVAGTVTTTPAGTSPPQTYSALYVVIDTTGASPTHPGAGWQKVVAPGENGEYSLSFNGQPFKINGSGVMVFGKPNKT